MSIGAAERSDSDRAWTAATIVLLAGVWAMAVYRSITWSVTADEALTYNIFLSRGWTGLLVYGANNHVLFSWLAKCSIGLFGLSGWSLRLPTVTAAALYLGCVGWLAVRFFGGWWRCLAAGLLAINPLMMDYLVAARGYGLSSALLLAALALVLPDTRAQTDPAPARRWAVWRCRTISALSGLAVVANLAFAPAAAAVICVSLWRTRGRHWPHLVLPAALLTAALLGPYLVQFGRHNLQVGFRSFSYTAIDLWDSSLHHDALAQSSLSQVIRHAHLPAGATTLWGQAGLCAWGLLLMLCLLRSPWRGRDLNSPAAAAAMAFACAVAFILLLHLAGKVPYPAARTALFLVPMGTLAALLMATEARAALRGAAALMGILLLAVYARQLHSRCFAYARYDAGARQLFLAMQDDARVHFHRPVRVGGTWIYEPAVNFYRALCHADWMLPMQRDYQQPTPAQFDYFLGNPADYPPNFWPQSAVVAAEPVSGTQLMRGR